MDTKQIKENKLKMILGFSIPSIIAMLLETVITITDGYFTGNYVGENALAAINLGLPILYFYLGAGLCIGVGGSVISGRLLGAKEKQKASEVFRLFYRVLPDYVVCLSTYGSRDNTWDVYSNGWKTTGMHVCKHCRVHSEYYSGLYFGRYIWSGSTGKCNRFSYGTDCYSSDFDWLFLTSKSGDKISKISV